MASMEKTSMVRFELRQTLLEDSVEKGFKGRRLGTGTKEVAAAISEGK